MKAQHDQLREEKGISSVIETVELAVEEGLELALHRVAASLEAVQQWWASRRRE
jgi:hypothetical protein